MRPTTTSLRRTVQLLGVLLLLAASVPASAQSCAFQGGASPAITFPALDPSNAVVATASTQLRIRCTGAGVPPPSSWTITGSGAWPTFSLQMTVGGTTYLIPYTLSGPTFVSSSGPSNQTYQLTATIQPTAYLNAPAGTYSDSLSVTVNP